MNFCCGFKASATISRPFKSCQLNHYWITHLNICGVFFFFFFVVVKEIMRIIDFSWEECQCENII